MIHEDDAEMWRRFRRDQPQWSADHDKAIALFRRVWEACSKLKKNELKSLLHTLRHVQERLWAASSFRLDAPNIATATFEGCPELGDKNVLNRELSRTPSVFISPTEYLCAIACWEAGEAYVPAKIVWAHKRWPYINPWDATPPAPPQEMPE